MPQSRTLVLTAAPGAAALTEADQAAARRAVPHASAWEEHLLAPGTAWAAVFSAETDGASIVADGDAAAMALSARPVDVNLLSSSPQFRKRRLLVADMESTIIGQELIDELADYVGLREKISDITARAMRGELDFESALKERVAMLAGLDASVLDEVYDKRVTLMPGAGTLIRTMKANGATCALVSGGFTVFTERIAERLGFDEQQANVLEIENGKLTGRVKEPILGRAAKRAALERIAHRLGLPMEATLAVGDGANDLDMLSAAGLGVAFRAKPKVQEAARAMPNGAVVTHGDLTALLYLQGYCSTDFALAG